ncbi:Helix-turn-helix domain [Popillia japonica]|uniref:Helix-turn-helix domain n=1 Tax=Popillia japonica TaxID=7064 RepID=A0AAW1GF17_POPJA
MLIRLNYPQEELQQFFSAAVGKELSFVEYIEQNWDKYATLQEFADAMHLSMRQFTRRFQALYNNSPYQWILDQKSRRIHRELIYTQKTLARISSEQHFKSVSHFNVFCKIHLGQTPGAIRKDRDIKLKKGEEKDGERDKRERKNLHANN